MNYTSHYKHSKNWGCVVALSTISFLFLNSLSTQLKAQGMSAYTINGSSSTSDVDFTTISNMQVTIDVTGLKSILLIASFQSKIYSPGSDVREASYRLADLSNPDTINSGRLRTSLSYHDGYDYRIGTVEYIFDVTGQTGNKTFAFQHAFTNSSRDLVTDGNLIAVVLKSGSEYIQNDVIKVTTPDTLSSVWEPLRGSTTKVVRSTRESGFFVAASVEGYTSNYKTSAIGEWKLQYRIGSTGVWNDLGLPVESSFLKIKNSAIVSLVHTLPDNTLPGDYYFRIAHRQTSTESTIISSSANLVALSLGIQAGIFPVFNSSLGTGGVATSSSAFSNSLSLSLNNASQTNYVLHSQFQIGANDSTDSPQYDLQINNTSVAGTNYKRFVKSPSDIGNGGMVALSLNNLANTTTTVKLRHASANGKMLTTKNISLNGFALTMQGQLLPIELLYLNTQCGEDSLVKIKWASASETNNHYYTLLRSLDGQSWTEIAQVKGAGNSNTIQNYEFNDIKATEHHTYYKLKQTDYDGASEEFDIVSVYCKYNHKHITVYPIPVHDFLTFSFLNVRQLDELLTFHLYNSAGVLCYTTQFQMYADENSYSIRLPSSIKNGIYFLHVVQPDNTYFHTCQIKVE